MKAGGNASATEFFTKRGGQSLLSDSDTKKKYSSPTAELYREELAKRVKEDAVRYDTCLFFSLLCPLVLLRLTTPSSPLHLSIVIIQIWC